MTHAPDSPLPRRLRKAARPVTPEKAARRDAYAAEAQRIRRAAREGEVLGLARQAAEASEARALAETAPPPAPPALDAHGHNPEDYQWLPVLRRPRKDGWTPQRQQDFIAALAETGNVTRAASASGMSSHSAYRLRRSPGGEAFAAAWDVALHHAARLLLDVTFERAFNGTDEPVFNKNGDVVGRRMRQNDRLAMFLLRAYMPERFRHAHRDTLLPGEELPPAPPPLETMIERIAPEPPAAPHALMAPEDLADALTVADMLPGELPHWHRGGRPEPLVPPKELDEKMTRWIHGDRTSPEWIAEFVEVEENDNRYPGKRRSRRSTRSTR